MRGEKLYKRGGIWWCRVRDRRGRIVRKSTGCRDYEAAARATADFERAAIDPVHEAATKALFGGSVMDYLTDLDRRGRSPATKKIARQKTGHFVRIWGAKMPMAKISGPLVLEYIDKRRGEGVVQFTIKKELDHLGQILTIARYLGKFHLPNERVIPPYFSGEHKPRERVLTVDEISSLLPCLRPDRAAHVAWFIATGGRLEESYRAQRGDEDFDNAVVHVRGTKTKGSDDYVPITPVSRALLDFALDNAPGKKGLLFERWGKLHRDLAAACKRAGIAKATPNDLRRTFGTLHKLAGLDTQTVSKMLRHTTDKLAQTTYAKVGGEPLAEFVNRKLQSADGSGKSTVPDLYRRTGTDRVNCPNGTGETAEKTSDRRSSVECVNRLRKPLLYPLSYGGNQAAFSTDHESACGGVAVAVPDLYASAVGLAALRAHEDGLDRFVLEHGWIQ